MNVFFHVYSGDFTAHIEHLRAVFHRLKKHKVKLRPEKCELFKKEVSYLGRIITPEGYKIDPDNVEAVQKLCGTRPSTLGELRKVLGFLGYFQRFIQDFARIAKPLYALLTETSMTGTKSNVKPRPSSAAIAWNEQHDTALKRLVDSITSDQVLCYPDFNKPFVLHTDASKIGLGAILYQKQEDKKLKAVAFASRSLDGAEKNYHSSKLEFLALKWAVAEKFKPYLYYASHIDIYTDNNPLTYVTTTAKLSATGQRWVNLLAEYKMTIHYRKGSQNIDAHFLSRYPLNLDELKRLKKSYGCNQ